MSEQITNNKTRKSSDILMMFRHLFGSWLPQLNPTTSFFNNSKLITQYESDNESEEKKEEFHSKMMTLRTLEYSDSSLEVVPQLKEAEGSSKEFDSCD